MTSFFKSFGKGILYIIGLPFALLFLAVVAVIGLPIIVFLFLKSILLFFKGETLDSDFEEDIQAKKILNPGQYLTQEEIKAAQSAATPDPVKEEHKTSSEAATTYLFTPTETFVPVMDAQKPEREVNINAIDEQEVLKKVYEEKFLDEPEPVKEQPEPEPEPENAFLPMEEPLENEQYHENKNDGTNRVYFDELDMSNDDDSDRVSINITRRNGEDR